MSIYSLPHRLNNKKKIAAKIFHKRAKKNARLITPKKLLTTNLYSVSGRSLCATQCSSVPEYTTALFIHTS